MATALKNLNDYNKANFADVSDKKVGIVVAEWHNEITDVLCTGAIDTLLKHGIKKENIFRNTVPGSFELTLGAQFLALQPEIDAVICIGVVIKGDTKHDDYINHAVANGLTNVALKFNKPVAFGLVTTNNLEQALDRAGGKHGNKGVEAAAAVIGMLSF
ncbi:6,7-dimethyl-8-ribityllumazine synthase [Pontibacter sp. SGAir0037]|uniref:6,7-dimethyl-8-ribityllumazine synthase n=1 Tax=Pontibacter sp. SGAir0037 TaxID=2571030 RepID=UPI0010CCD0E6|nr:6,7-dimethyl-8-ribityllumazine synthase [Pontibacter sp. SGAir0037]QCR24031.1 6,7-dimethyl-8-ribityllumazine synthase [Pontibacter sp. SGAir0037]